MNSQARGTLADHPVEHELLTPYLIPETPPAEVLAELDAAARTLDELSARAVQLTLGMDEQMRSLRIELEDADGPRRLSPTQLLDLLAGA